MLEQKDLTGLQKNKSIEDVSRLLELARIAHEKYLMRNNTYQTFSDGHTDAADILFPIWYYE